MFTLPKSFRPLFQPFAPLFSKPVFSRAALLAAGAILAPGKRTVTSVLRILGRSGDQHFQNFHRVLNRDRWSSVRASRILLTLLVKATGLRWLCFMLLAGIPWAGRLWALPFLTLLAPSRHFYEKKGRRHSSLLERARQGLRILKKWLPGRELIVAADSTFASIEWLAALSRYACIITRLRLDAALYEPVGVRKPGTPGRSRKKGKRLPSLAEVLKDKKTRWAKVRVSQWYGEADRLVEIATGTAVWYHSGMPVVPLRWVLIRDPEGKFEAQALLSTGQEHEAGQIVCWFVGRWQMEVTFEEVRAHMGAESQRQWSDKAIARTTPALLGLHSLVVLMARELMEKKEQMPVRQAAWYEKKRATFSDTIALVRRHLWRDFSMSHSREDMVKIPRTLLNRFTDALCYAQ